MSRELVGRRVLWVDNSKALGIILVVLGHSVATYMSRIGEYDLLQLNQWIYSFHMPLFFFLSGYVMPIDFKCSMHRSPYTVLKNSLVLIYIYILWTFINLIYTQYLTSNPNKVFLSDYFYYVVVPIGELWYIQSLIIIYILLSWTSSVKVEVKHVLVVFIFALYLDSSQFLRSSTVSYYIIYSLLGVIFSKLSISYRILHVNKSFSRWSILLTIPLLVVIQVYLTFSTNLKFLTAVLGGGVVLLVSVLLKNNTLSFLGRCALPIYLMHTPLVHLFVKISTSIFDHEIAYIHIFSSTFFAVALPVYFYKISQDTVLIRLFQYK